MAKDAAILLGAYLLGSIPFSYIVARLFGVRDVRRVGSGNVGATNVMRSAGRTAGVLAFLLDAAKGGAAAAVVQRLSPAAVLPALAAVAAVLGHMYPPWLSFKGGKGVATGMGAFLPMAPLATAGGIVAFVAATAVTRYVSLGSCTGAVVLAGLTFVTGVPAPVAWCAAVCAAFILWKHRANAARILAGTESRLGAPKG